MRKIGVGVIGCGEIAYQAHLPCFKRIPEVDLIAVADIVPERAKAAAEEFGVKFWYSDYQKVLDRDDIDAVSIATPHGTHAEIAIRAAEAGKHILCEKPLATNVKEADAMVNAARKAGVKLMTGYQNRFTPLFQKIKELLDNEIIGQIYEVSTIGSSWHSASPWFYQREKAGGGIGLDSVVYTTYEWNCWVGKVDSVYAFCDTRFPEREATEHWLPPDIKTEASKSVRSLKKIKVKVTVEDSFSCIIRFKNGAVGLIYRSWTSRAQAGMRLSEIDGSDGCIIYNSPALIKEGVDLAIKTIRDMDGISRDWNYIQLPKLAHGEAWFLRAKHFIDCIIQDKEPLVTGEDGRDAVEVIQAAYISSLRGEPVKLPLPR